MPANPSALLSSETTTTPGTPVLIDRWYDGIQIVAASSSDFTGTNITVQAEWSESSTGPWENLNTLNISSPDEFHTFYHTTTPTYIGYVRAKLLSTPTTGSISCNVYFKD